jgi:hypothetical protein
MKKIMLMIWLVCLLFNIRAQVTREGLDAIPEPFKTQGFVIEPISGSGFDKSVNTHIANITSSNPAILYDFNGMALGLSYQFESAIKPAWIADLDYHRGATYIPQSFGLVMPLNRFRIGAGFSQRYNSIFEYEPMAITSAEQPEGTGELFSASETGVVYCFSGHLAYALNTMLQTDDELCIGIQLNYNLLDFENRIHHVEAQSTGSAPGWAAGLHYRIAKNFQAGLFFEKSPHFDEKFEIKSDDLIIQHDIDTALIGNNQNIFAAIRSEFFIKEKLPDKLNFGLLYRLSPVIKIVGDLTYVYWSQLSEGTENHLDISGCLTVDLFKNGNLTLGFLSTGRKYDDEIDRYFNTNQNLYGLYLSAGMNIRFHSYDIDFAFLTSTSSSGEWREQNIGKIGVGVYL